jgi:hypothetical protein
LLRADQQAMMSSSRCWQQLRGIKTAADHARDRNRKGIVDGGLYLVRCSKRVAAVKTSMRSKLWGLAGHENSSATTAF